MRKDYVQKLAEAMLRGEWELNGDSVRVGISGRLLDGQHRCAAVVASGVTIQVILVTGLDDGVFTTIDRGMGRTAADSLSLAGELHCSRLAAMTRLLYIYRMTGNPFTGGSSNQPTTKQLMDLLEAEPSLRDSVRYCASAKWSAKHVTSSNLGFCHFLFTKKDAGCAREFFEKLESGIGLDAGDPVLHLRNRISDSRSLKDRLTNTYRLALIFKAFKYSRDGASVKLLRVRAENGVIEKDSFIL